MSTEPVDYMAILADLEAKKAALEQAIASFRNALALGALGASDVANALVPSVFGPSTFVPSITGGEIPAGAFLGKSISEAAKLYLEIVKKKQTTREIADALPKGGIESTSKKNWIPIVHAALVRIHKAGALVKIGNQWGLAVWYPKGIGSATTTTASRVKKKQRKTKNNEPSKPLALQSAPPGPESTAGLPRKANERALEFLSHNHGEHSLAEVSKHLGMGVKGARLILGKLVKKGKARMSAPGMYTVEPFRSEAVH
jgi:hypothetical protein